jgi:hypothetical protein
MLKILLINWLTFFRILRLWLANLADLMGEERRRNIGIYQEQQEHNMKKFI